MVSIFTEGFLLGLATLFLIGPIIWLLLDTVVQEGKIAGLKYNLGVITGDILYAVIIFFGGDLIIQLNEQIYFLSWVGFLITLTMGGKYLWNVYSPKEIKRSKHGHPFLKGFMINFFNPFVLIVWTTFALNYQTSFGEPGGLGYYLIGFVVGIFTIDMIKLYFFQLINMQKVLKYLKYVYLVMGILFIIVSIKILFTFILSK